MATLHQFGISNFDDGSARQESREIAVLRMLVTAAFLASICLITLVIGAASVQYP